jgi:hypothetical protein
MNSLGILKLSLPALLFFSCVGVSRALLGDSEAQCIAQYGNESEVRDPLPFDVVGDRAASFDVGKSGSPLTLKVVFLNGVVAHETFSSDTSEGISLARKQAILDAERAGLQWSKTGTNYRTDRADNTNALESWVRSDGATAQCWMSGKAKIQFTGEIDLSSKAYTAAQRALDQQNGSG